MKKFLLFIFISLNIICVFGQSYDVLLRNNSYKLKIKETGIEQGKIYQINIYYPQTNFNLIKLDTAKSILAFSEPSFSFQTYNKQLTQLNKNSLTELLSGFLKTSLANDTVLTDTTGIKLKQEYIKNAKGEYSFGSIKITDASKFYVNDEKIENFHKYNNLITEADKKEVELQAQVILHKRNVASVKKDIDKEESAGLFFVTKTVKLYESDDNSTNQNKILAPSDTIKITNLEFSVEEGVIRYLKVKGIDSKNNEYSFHNQISIPLKTPKVIFKHYEDRLFNLYAPTEKQNYFIKFGDLMEYDYDPKINTDNFSPKDTVISIDFTKSEKAKIKIPVSQPSISSAFDVRLYSDLMSSVFDQAAGVVQTEAVVKFNLNSSYWSNKHIIFGNYFEPYINFATFKDDYSGLALSKENETDTFKTEALNLQRFSNFQTGFKLNLLRGDMRRLSSSTHINFIGGILNTKVIDTTFTLTQQNDSVFSKSFTLNKNNILTAKVGFEFLWKTMQFSTFGIDMSVGVYGLKLLNSGDSYKLKNYNFTINETSFTSQFDMQVVYDWRMLIYYNPPNNAGSMFVRTGYYGALGDAFTNSYLYAQFGYSLDIAELIAKKNNK